MVQVGHQGQDGQEDEEMKAVAGAGQRVGSVQMPEDADDWLTNEIEKSWELRSKNYAVINLEKSR